MPQPDKESTNSKPAMDTKSETQGHRIAEAEKPKSRAQLVENWYANLGNLKAVVERLTREKNAQAYKATEDVVASLRTADSSNYNANGWHTTAHPLKMAFGSTQNWEAFRSQIPADSPYGNCDIAAAVCIGIMVEKGANLQDILNPNNLQNEELRELRELGGAVAEKYRKNAFKNSVGQQGETVEKRTGNIPGLAYACEKGKLALDKQYNALPPEKKEDMKANYKAITTFLDDTCKRLVSRVFDPQFKHETTIHDRDEMSTHFKKILDEMKADQKKVSQALKKSGLVMGGGGPTPK